MLNNWTQLVDEKTLYHGNCAASLLDHMYTNEPNFVNERLIDSDHCCIGAKIYLHGPAQYPKTFYTQNIKDIDEEEFVRRWKIYSETDVDTAVFKFNNKILQILEDLAPLKAITVRKNYAPWLTEELKELQSERNGLHSQARLTRREEDWTKWKRFRNDLGTSSGRQKRNTTSIT